MSFADPDPPTRHGMQVWCGVGCHEFNLIPQSTDEEAAIAGVAAVESLLVGRA